MKKVMVTFFGHADVDVLTKNARPKEKKNLKKNE